MQSSALERSALEAFRDRFEGLPAIVARAPARVELLGNHTDYNGGLVLAAAIDRFTVVAARRSAGTALARIASVNMNEQEAVDLGALDRDQGSSWGRYVKGVLWAIQEEYGGIAGGFDLAIAGDVPLGAGLSSSASLQGAVALGMIGLGLVPTLEPELDDKARLRLAKTLQRSENAYVGVASGLLDQFSVLFGRASFALTLDCRSLEYERVPLGAPAPAIVVCDSRTSRQLADGMYNHRRAECERVVSHFQAKRGLDAVRWLRAVSLADLEADWSELDPVGRLRARHVLTENDRVAHGAESLKAGNLEEFGRLMSRSHASSRDDFANSSPALDALVEAAEAAPGFLGGKLSGAGWAGCTVNLVRLEAAEAFAEAVKSSYAKRSGKLPDVHICVAAEGAAATAVADSYH